MIPLNEIGAMPLEDLSSFVKTYRMTSSLLEYARSLFSDSYRTWDKHYYIRSGREGTSEIDSNYDVEPLISNCWGEYPELLTFIFDCLSSYYSIFPSSYTPTVSAVRLNRYEKGQLMKPHVDHITSLFDGNARGVPVLSIVGLVNKAEEGGEFFMNFKESNEQFLTDEGELLIFPSSFLYKHEVKPVKKGTRDSFVSWTFF